MRVLVCGAGEVGYNIARQLSAEDNDVVVVDHSSERIQKVSDGLDVQSMTGFASHPDVLERAGAADADMLIAVTQSDEINIVACQVGHSLFDVRPRSRGSATRPISKRRGPTCSAATTCRSTSSSRRKPRWRAQSPGGSTCRARSTSRASPTTGRGWWACGSAPTAPSSTRPLRQLNELFPDLDITIVYIVRGDKTLYPASMEQLLPGDEIYFVAETGQLPRAMSLFGHEEKAARRLLLVGGGNIGLMLARQIEAADTDVDLKLIEHDKARAGFVADRLEDTVVLNGDALDTDLLDEANVSETETVVAVTTTTRSTCWCRCSPSATAACARSPSSTPPPMPPLISPLGIDASVSPRELTVSSILQHVRRGRIRSVYSMRDGEAEVIEVEALETSPVVGRPLKDVRFPPRRADRRGGPQAQRPHPARQHRPATRRYRGRILAPRRGQESGAHVRGRARILLASAAAEARVNSAALLGAFGRLLVVLAAAHLPPFALALAEADAEAARAFALGAACTLFPGGVLVLVGRGGARRLERRDAITFAVAGWGVAGLFAAVPFMLSGAADFSGSVLEAVSGVTASGLGAIERLDEAPRAILLWRAILQWIGGYATLVFVSVLAPRIALSAPAPEAFRPRPRQVAGAAAALYAVLTAAAGAALAAAGAPPFQAACYAMSGISTGGFAAGGGGPAALGRGVEAVLMLTMAAGALNLLGAWRAGAARAGAVTDDTELVPFLAFAAAGAGVVAVALAGVGGVPGRGHRVARPVRRGLGADDHGLFRRIRGAGAGFRDSRTRRPCPGRRRRRLHRRRTQAAPRAFAAPPQPP